MLKHCYRSIGRDELGEKFEASSVAASTWSDSLQHAAPVSALLVRALEQCGHRDDTRLSRVVVDLLGPVPMAGEFRVSSTTVRRGKQIELVEAEMVTDAPGGESRRSAVARGWRMQHFDTSEISRSSVDPLVARDRSLGRDYERSWGPGYTSNLEWCWSSFPGESGPGEAWARVGFDLVEGEVLSPLQRLFAVADIANGVGAKLDYKIWSFPNTDLTVHIDRVPSGEWIGIRADADYGIDGIGTTRGTLFDELGPVAHTQQSIFVRPRDL